MSLRPLLAELSGLVLEDSSHERCPEGKHWDIDRRQCRSKGLLQRLFGKETISSTKSKRLAASRGSRGRASRYRHLAQAIGHQESR